MADQGGADQHPHSGITSERSTLEYRGQALVEVFGNARVGDMTTDPMTWRHEFRSSPASNLLGELASTNQGGHLPSSRDPALLLYNPFENFERQLGYQSDAALSSLTLEQSFELPPDPNFRLVRDGQYQDGLAGDRAIPRHMPGMPELLEAVDLSRTRLASSSEIRKSTETQQVAPTHLPTEYKETTLQQGRSCEDSQKQKLRAWFLDISITLEKGELTISVRGKLPPATRRRPKHPNIPQIAVLPISSHGCCCIPTLYETQTEGLETDFSSSSYNRIYTL
jgi:hypothetical protein